MKNEMKKIADFYGVGNQALKLIEECAELIQQVAKYRTEAFVNTNADNSLTSVAEEIADVEIMIWQIKYLFRIGKDVEEKKKEKVKRQLERMGVL